MQVKWELDDATVVEATFGAFRKEVVSVNGTEVLQQRRMKRKGDLPFTLPDGRTGTITLTPQLIGRPYIDLHVAGRLYAETPKKPYACPACSATVKPNDRFCDACGQAQPTAEQRLQQRQVGEATGAMRGLAGLFAVSGVIMYFVSSAQAAEALSSMAAMDAATEVPVEGNIYTVAELRQQIAFEPWSLLISNWVLAVAMVGLAMWGKRAPLPAVLVATATYAAVIVVNAIIDPRTIAQGIFVKIIVIVFFVRGIKAALALRAANA